MGSLFPILALGLILGMRHATDPDHVIAVTTLVARHKSVRSAALIGAVWGIGHTLTILVVGGGIILLGWVIPERVGVSLEISVGVMLILLGVVSLSSSFRQIRSGQAAEKPEAWLDRRLGTTGAWMVVRPLVIGIVHGLAGSAAVALLVLATIKDPAWAVFYLLVFGAGTVLGMMLITMVISLPFRYADRRFARLNTGMRIASGVISVGFGVWMAVSLAR